MVAKIGWDLGWEGLSELVDTGLNSRELDAINRTIESVNGVKSHHMLRTRRMGEDVLVEVHIVVGSQVTVSEGHQISDKVQMKLKEAHTNVTEVMVHIDPEDDETTSTTIDLPSREEVLKRLKVCWASLEAAEKIEQVNLHYLEGKIDVELVLPLMSADNLQDAQQIAESFAKQAESEDDIGNVRVLFH